MWAQVEQLAECMVRRVNAREKFRMKESLRQCIRPVVESVLLAMMRYAAYLSFENAPASYGPFRQAGFRCAVLTVLSSSLVRCRPRWENLMLRVAKPAYTVSASGTAR